MSHKSGNDPCVADLALPYYKRPPPYTTQRSYDSPVSKHIGGQLSPPKPPIRLWDGRSRALGMTVPEAAMNKKGYLELWEY